MHIHWECILAFYKHLQMQIYLKKINTKISIQYTKGLRSAPYYIIWYNKDVISCH